MNEGATSIPGEGNRPMRLRMFERQIWALRSLFIRGVSRYSSYEEMVTTCEFINACEAYSNVTEPPQAYVDITKRILSEESCEQEPPEFRNQAIHWFSPQMFIRYDPDGTWLNFHSPRIPECGEEKSWCQLPDVRRVQQIRDNSITSLTEEMFIDLGKLGPYLDGYDSRVKIAQNYYYHETYWIGVYFANEDQFAKILEIRDNPLSAPDFEPDSPEARVLMAESYSPINNP